MNEPSEMFDTSDVFEIVRKLGQGTTGTVYEAHDTRLNRRVVLKIPLLLPEAERQVKTHRFMRECQVLASLTSRPDCNIPRLLEVSQNAAGQPYCVREFVEGSSLEQLATAGDIDLRRALAVLMEVAWLVQWVHDRGYVHRNLSAANVLVASDGSTWLIGFGGVGMLAGSPGLPPGATGTPAAADVRGLQDLLRWVCEVLAEPLPPGLERLFVAGSVPAVEQFCATLAGYL